MVIGRKQNGRYANKKHMRDCRVSFNGVDLTGALHYADSRLGVIRGYCINETGTKFGGYLKQGGNPHELQQFEARGSVEIRLNCDTPIDFAETNRRLFALVPESHAVTEWIGASA